MDSKLKAKEQKEILQILTKLKTCPTPQGGVFVFLLALLIFEDFEKEETLELINVILLNENIDFLEEWDFYITVFSFLLSKINQIELKSTDLINNLKNVPVFLEEKRGKQILIEDLKDFINKYKLVVSETEKRKKLKKMLESSLNLTDKTQNLSKKVKNGNR
jgi:benzoyl-CoA reductase/2-hydroxyglutaryl-CoA dehydratase subunit BcrC/BadD/HgdB